VVDGATSAHLKLAQSNVSDKFAMRIPLYLQMQNGDDGASCQRGHHGNKTIDTNVQPGQAAVAG